MNEKETKIADIERRLKNARNRALFWSGNPSLSRNRFKPGSRMAGNNGWEQYELAMCDVRSLSGILEDLTGKRVKPYDPKLKFQQGFSATMRKVQSKQ